MLEELSTISMCVNGSLYGNEEQEDYYILCGWMSEKDTGIY